MDKSKLRDLFDNVLELEALIQLALVRDDCSADLLRLIDKKLLNLKVSESGSNPQVDINASGFKEPKEYSLENDNPENNDSLNKSDRYSEVEKLDYDNSLEIEELPEEEEEYDNEVKESELDTDILESDNSIEEEIINEDSEEDYDIYDLPVENDEVSSEEDLIEKNSEILTEEKDSDFPEESDTEKTPQEEKESLPQSSHGSSSRLKGKLIFSINDRYRFKRELFDNSDAEFNTTMAFVASMENYAEAEDYFLDELGFDPKNRTVADFMAILSGYFK